MVSHNLLTTMPGLSPSWRTATAPTHLPSKMPEGLLSLFPTTCQHVMLEYHWLCNIITVVHSLLNYRNFPNDWTHTHWRTHKHTNTYIDRLTDIRTDICICTYRRTDRQTYVHTDITTDIRTHIQTYTHRHTYGQTDRQTYYTIIITVNIWLTTGNTNGITMTTWQGMNQWSHKMQPIILWHNNNDGRQTVIKRKCQEPLQYQPSYYHSSRITITSNVFHHCPGRGVITWWAYHSQDKQ